MAPIWIVVALLLLVVYLVGRLTGSLGRWQRGVDSGVARAIGDLRSRRGFQAGTFIHGVLTWWLMILARWVIAIALAWLKRWRHLAVFVGSVVLVDSFARWFPTAGAIGSGVPGRPSGAMAGVAVTMLGVVYGLTPPGVPRRIALAVMAGLLAVVAAMLLLRNQDTFSELVVGLSIGVAIPFLGYRILAPESVFPLTLRHGRTAHLDVTGARGIAIRRALEEQMGLAVDRVEPFGLLGSGGCTPLRITLHDGSLMFGKLYATNHLRADRWYKLGRTVLYGSLEDERSFNSVRRMVEYEDYMLRLLRDQGVHSARPGGFVELTREREYLLVSSFVEGAVEIQEAETTDEIIRSGVGVIRMLWDAGIAHRDIKPSNLLVSGNEAILIDVFFCQVRPSPWRQAVDLANMLLTLALGSDPENVYRIALERFTPSEIAEAFAASKGVTIPTQLRKMLAEDGRDLLSRFRELAPALEPINIQRWSVRRIALASGLFAGTLAAFSLSLIHLKSLGFKP